MRTITLAVAISSLLLGAAAVAAEPHKDPSQHQPAQTTPQTDTSRPATTPASPETNAAAETSSTEVGSEKSNVDEDSSSGSYYPYSAGTVGDDPAEPKSTAVSPDSSDDPTGPTDQWGNIDADGDGYLSLSELTKAAPALSASFGAMDVDGDEKLTRGEFRTWHESHKTKRDADQDANTSSRTDDIAPNSGTPPGSSTGS
jgi:hypothetical protein